MIINNDIWNTGYNLLVVDDNGYVKLKHYTDKVLSNITGVETDKVIIDHIDKYTLSVYDGVFIYVIHTTIDHLVIDLEENNKYIIERDLTIPDNYKTLFKVTNNDNDITIIRVCKSDPNDDTKMIYLNKWMNSILFDKHINFKFTKCYRTEDHNDDNNYLNIVLQNNRRSYGVINTSISNGSNINSFSYNPAEHDDHETE